MQHKADFEKEMVTIRANVAQSAEREISFENNLLT